jgi:Flp pilus assembly pilin Flp
MSSAHGGGRQLVRSEDGQDLVEYAMLVACIALLLVATLQATDTSIQRVFSVIIDSLGAAS